MNMSGFIYAMQIFLFLYVIYAIVIIALSSIAGVYRVATLRENTAAFWRGTLVGIFGFAGFLIATFLLNDRGVNIGVFTFSLSIPFSAVVAYVTARATAKRTDV